MATPSASDSLIQCSRPRRRICIGQTWCLQVERGDGQSRCPLHMKKLLLATTLLFSSALTLTAQRPPADQARSPQPAQTATPAIDTKDDAAKAPAPLAALTPAQRAKLQRKTESLATRRFGDPDLAEEFYVNSRTGPIITRGANRTRGVRPLSPSMYFPAMRQKREMPRYSSRSRQLLPSAASSPGGAADPFSALTAATPGGALGTWTNVGPANQGGRTRALLIDPGNPSVMYAGGVAGGVWKSTDAGASWTPYGDQMANIGVVTLAFDPQNTSVLYAGTGEGVGNVDAVRGAGIFKSTDAGLTWSQLASTNNSDFYYTMQVLVSPRNTQRLWAATRLGVYRSLDAGTTWTNVLNASAVGGCTDMAMQVQSASGYVFASCGRTASQGTVYRADDSDVSTFASILGLPGQGRSSIAVAPSDERVVYVLASQRTAGAGPGQYGLHGVYRSAPDVNGDGGNGDVFTTMRQGNVAPASTAQKINQLLLSNPVIALLTECGFGTSSFLNQGWYDNVIAVDPVNPNVVWAGGVDLWRSDNGGVDWGAAGYWWFTKGVDPEYHHADQHGIVFHPNYDGTSNKVMFSASDGGVERIDDARAPVNTTLAQLCGTPVAGSPTWIDRNNGYTTTQFYDGAVYPDGQTYFGGMQDNGTQRGTTASANWTTLFGGDGGYVAVDTLGDGNAANDVLFLENTGNSLRKSTDGGATFPLANTGITGSGFLFIAPFTMNEGNRQQLWTGGFDIWRTVNQAGAWARATGVAGTCGVGSISAIATHPLDGNRVLIGMSDGCYHYNHAALSAPNTGSWPGGTFIGAGTRQGLGLISWMAWDPQDINVAYAAISAFGVNNLLKSTNGGVTWAPSVGTGPTALPQIPVRSVIVSPTDSLQVFVGTDLGVFTSVDGGASWYVENTGFANVSVNSLKFDAAGNTLFAFTHGRGAWKTTLGGSTCTTITLGAGPLPGGALFTSYSHTLSASGGTAPYSFGMSAGALPPGLTLSSGGAVTGTPTAVGTYNFTVTATDDNGCSGTATYSIAVVDNRIATTTVVTFEAGPYVYRGTPYMATALVTSADLSFSQAVAVSYSGDCTAVTSANGCTATASFAATASYLGSSGSASITITPAPTSTTAGNTTATFGDVTATLTATVSSASATVNEGSVEFTVKQGATTLGAVTSGAVTAGAASATFSIPAGTPAGVYSVDATYLPGTNFTGSTDASPGTLSIGQFPTTSTVTVTPASSQYSDAVTFEATLTPMTIVTGPPATSVTFFVGTQNMGTVALAAAGGALKGTLTADLVEPAFTLAGGALKPNASAKTVRAVFGGVDANALVGEPTTTLTVTKEDARVVYTGMTFVNTGCATCSTATSTLSATVQDITATADAAGDTRFGDIRNARVTFVVRGVSPAPDTPITGCSSLPVQLVDAADTKTGTVACNWQVTISGNSSDYRVGVVVDHYYGRNHSDDDTVVTVSQPLTTNFITGGGYLVNTSSAGLYAGAAGRKTNFGFNVKYNKAGKNLQGQVNVIVRGAGGRVYQIKGNSMDTLAANVTTPANRTAVYSGKANLTDITDVLNPIALGGGHIIQMRVSDRGEPGATDSVGITLLENGTGAVLFSSAWNGTASVEQQIGGGNVQVR